MIEKNENNATFYGYFKGNVEDWTESKSISGLFKNMHCMTVVEFCVRRVAIEIFFLYLFHNKIQTQSDEH